MVTTLSQLVEMIERGTVPPWLRDQIITNKDRIGTAIRDGGEVILAGPDGERVTIRGEKQPAAA
jgi:hypothetical protein